MMRFSGAIGFGFLGRKAARQGCGHFEWRPIGDQYGKGYVEQGDMRFVGLNGTHSRQGKRPNMGIRFMFQNWHTACRAFVSQPGIISPASR
jgi:hypothetical protein